MVPSCVRIGTLAAASFLLALTMTGRPTVEPEVRLGTFDSRAVAIAYAHSETFEAWRSALRADHAKAKADGDEARIAECEARGSGQQELFHQQAFCAAPVDDILEHIRDALPAVAVRAGVDVIVSKWDLVYRDPSAEVLDVTDLIVAEFEPSEPALKIIREMAATEPLPLEALGEH